MPSSSFHVVVLLEAFRVKTEQSLRRQSQQEELLEGRSSCLLPGKDANSVWFRYLINTVVNRWHSRWCPAYVEESEQAQNTTKVTRH